jgi:hypothetical protein
VAGVQLLDFDSPDETRAPDKTRVDVVRLGDTTAARFAFEPGWKWSECVKPVVGTDSCQVRHVGVVQSGRLAVRHEDGSEAEVGPGQAYVIEPGPRRMGRRRRGVCRTGIRVALGTGVRAQLEPPVPPV